MKAFRMENSILLVGTTDEICPVAGAIYRAAVAGNTNLGFSHCGKPRFAPGRIYGLDIYDDGVIYPVTEETIADFMADGLLEI